MIQIYHPQFETKMTLWDVALWDVDFGILIFGIPLVCQQIREN